MKMLAHQTGIRNDRFLIMKPISGQPIVAVIDIIAGSTAAGKRRKLNKLCPNLEYVN